MYNYRQIFTEATNIKVLRSMLCIQINWKNYFFPPSGRYNQSLGNCFDLQFRCNAGSVPVSVTRLGLFTTLQRQIWVVKKQPNWSLCRRCLPDLVGVAARDEGDLREGAVAAGAPPLEDGAVTVGLAWEGKKGFIDNKPTAMVMIIIQKNRQFPCFPSIWTCTVQYNC